MERPDGTTLTHEQAPYDPIKAHEYYMRNRKLKGLKGGAKQTPKKDLVKYQAALSKFLGKLPMAESGDLKKTAAFVNRMSKMTDKEMVAEAVKIRKAHGNKDGNQVATINVLLKNRTRIRKAKGNKNPSAVVESKAPLYLPPVLKTSTTKN